MAMGLGCNAVGVAGCRIISSPRERLIAVLTNSLVPCNGKFSTMIVLISTFISGRSAIGAMILLGFVILSFLMTFIASAVLNKTLLSGHDSQFILELPPYRKPRVGKIIVRSVLDRTVFVLGRAVVVSVPAGILIWALQQIEIDGVTVLHLVAGKLEPMGKFLGMSGAALLAFALSFPANELMLPLTIMLIQGNGLQEMSSAVTGDILTSAGWTGKTAICVLLFLLFHWPCGTTCLTIRKETGSWKWTLFAILIPTIIGILLCRLAACII